MLVKSSLTPQVLQVYLRYQRNWRRFGMLEERSAEETARRSAEVQDISDSLLPSLGLAFWRTKHAFERDVGLSTATWFLLSMLIEEDGISQGEVSLYITEEGRLLIEDCQERRERFESRFRREFGPEELAEFRRALGVVSRLMQD